MVLDVAVIIVNWNSGDLLRRCLGALSAQQARARRVLVIDNASGVPPSAPPATGSSPVEIVRLPRNVGFAAANNLAIDRANDCEWIALLNPDAFPQPDWLARLLDAAARNPGYTCFASRLLQDADPSRLDGAGDACHISGLVWRRGHGRPAARLYLEPAEVFSACAAAALYRRDAVRAVGGFDEDFFCYVEDVDLGFRLRLAGHRTLYVPDAVVHHVGSATTGRQSDFAVYHGQRNLVWSYVKNMPGWLFWAYLPAHLLVNLASVIWFALRGHPRAVLSAKRDALRGLAAAWRKRRAIQASRTVRTRALRLMLARGFPRRSS